MPGDADARRVVPFGTAVRAWLVHGTRGGLVAGGLFVLPGVVALLVLSAVYVAGGDTTAVTAVFAGLAPVVVAIVVQAVVRVGRRALTSRVLLGIAVAAFADDELHTERPSARRTLRVLLVGLVAWGVPMAALALLTGAGSVFTEQGLFFSGAAVVTFGGAYAVLAHIAQQAVGCTAGWRRGRWCAAWRWPRPRPGR